jgi:spore photoproduct lyase
MNKQVVYVEENIIEHNNTQVILKKLGNPTLIPIAHYKDVFNQTGGNWRMEKEAQHIILAERTDNFYYAGAAITPSFGHTNFYYNTLALNCIYDCDYCYLQGLFTSPHLVLFVNNESFIAATQKLLQQLQQPIYLALSYDTDLLALEHWYPYCQEWIAFAAQHPTLTLEIRTKSVNIKPLENIQPLPNIILAWTISPQEIIDWHEPKTPNLQARLKAIKKMIALGWQVRLCFDPLLYVPNFKNIYGVFLDTAAQELGKASLHSISIGVFRMNKIFLKRMRQQRADTSLLYYNFEIDEATETLSYKNEHKTTMINFVQEKIMQAFPQRAIELM